MTSSPPAIEIHALTHWYPGGQRAALDSVDLAVGRGEIFGILGPNGGGKTTLSRIIATLLKPSRGEASVFGMDTQRDPRSVRRQLGVVFQSSSVDDQLTAVENLECQGGLYGLSVAQARARASLWLQKLGLAERNNERVQRFSGGMRRRVDIARALLHDPRLLLMDEPTAGIDPTTQRRIWADLARLRDETGLTVALTTHLMHEAERCDRLAVVSEGQLVAVDRPDRLKALIGGDVITLEPASEQTDEGERRMEDTELTRQVADVLKTVDGQAASAPAVPRLVDGRIHIEHQDGPALVAKLFNALPNRFAAITVSRPTLEDVFVHLTGSTLE